MGWGQIAQNFIAAGPKYCKTLWKEMSFIFGINNPVKLFSSTGNWYSFQLNISTLWLHSRGFKKQRFHPIPLWSPFSSKIKTVCPHETNSQLMFHFNNFLEESFCIMNSFHEMLLCDSVLCVLLLKMSSHELTE